MDPVCMDQPPAVVWASQLGVLRRIILLDFYIMKILHSLILSYIFAHVTSGILTILCLSRSSSSFLLMMELSISWILRQFPLEEVLSTTSKSGVSTLLPFFLGAFHWGSNGVRGSTPVLMLLVKSDSNTSDHPLSTVLLPSAPPRWLLGCII